MSDAKKGLGMHFREIDVCTTCFSFERRADGGFSLQMLELDKIDLYTDMSIIRLCKKGRGLMVESVYPKNGLSRSEYVGELVSENMTDCEDRYVDILDCLKNVGLRAYMYDLRLSELSEEDAQRVALARAIAEKPIIVLTHEALSELESDEIDETFELLMCTYDSAMLLVCNAKYDIDEGKEGTDNG